MKRIILCLLLFFLLNKLNAQAGLYYSSGVKAFKQNELRQADSLFTLSLNEEQHVDTYYRRAVCRKKMGDQIGYCSDIGSAAALGDRESAGLFKKDCGIVDTVYNPQCRQKKDRPYYCKSIFYRYAQQNIESRFDQDNNFIFMLHNNDHNTGNEDVDTLSTELDQMAEFPGGITEMQKFIASHIYYPAEAREKGIGGKVFLKFVIESTGKITRIEVLKGISGCPACNMEAIRVISIMPLWKPASRNGKPISIYFNMPISYKVN